jgi:AraC family transcriptional regulator of adaptative response/methylated-DNA-[protein]-cysteine methyltransferase
METVKNRPAVALTVVSAQEADATGWRIEFGFAPTPFGECILGRTRGGICHLAFVSGGDRAGAEAQLRRQWPKAEFQRTDDDMARLAGLVFDGSSDEPLRVLARGSAFQALVWEALLRIPRGATTTYEALAVAIGKPDSARAVGGAVGSNSVGWLIPCHRVVPKTGGVGGYRWDSERKRAMLDCEAD